ncbi:universal stress protein [Streptomyces sp. ID05-39B]|uniref:universal stress protein n=1 Tax=Streptomyces sp. ID05-39B TaxID=3028664 RepID=UPI0029B0A630|nr:universal stress protein [Streptomyces sp. ID05-39B]MDX3525746.1 universal stress protein [Streptomyces sp. ID05-39B]
MLLGSTAASLAAHSRCPVMVAREDSADAGPIVLCVDGSPAGEPAVEFAFAEAALRGTEISAVHVWLPDHAPAGTGAESQERLLAQALAGHAEKYPDVTVRREVASAEARQVLIERSGSTTRTGASSSAAGRDQTCRDKKRRSCAPAIPVGSGTRSGRQSGRAPCNSLPPPP